MTRGCLQGTPLFLVVRYNVDVMFSRIKETFHHHKDHFLTIAFILGFIFDNLTLSRIDSLLVNVLLLAYVLLAMVSIMALLAGSAGKLPPLLNERAKSLAPLLAQYAFGSLFSGMLIFYGRSGSWLSNWPYLLIIIVVIYGNETIRDRVQRFLFNIGMLFVGLFSYVVLIVPVLVGKIGAFIFVVSGVLALIIMLFFIWALSWVVPRFIALHTRALVLIVGLIFAVFNFLYFFNFIPPIPLALKEVGIFHSIVRFENGGYELTYEKRTWGDVLSPGEATFRPIKNGNVYCFTKVFAPKTLLTDIRMKWEYYDETSRSWKTHSQIDFPIVGGSDGGYRGYSYIQNYTDGSWRCTVETTRGQIIGRKVFSIDSTKEAGELLKRRE